MHASLRDALFLLALCAVGACADSDTASPSTTATGAAAVGSTSSPTPTTTPLRAGNYNVTPLRTDGQRVTFRITMTDGVTAEISLAPPDATIERVQPSVSLVRPNGQPAGGREVFTSRADDEVFATYCASALGGNCTPRASEELADGNRFETFARADGGTATRVVFGPWAVLVQGRDVADAFTFRNGPDGFPLIAARSPGWSATNTELAISSVTSRYVLKSDPSGTCSAPAARTACDRGLTIQSSGPDADASLRRMN